MTIQSIVAYGDCNTRGINEHYGRAYPELLAEALGARVTNLGHTMSTTRELVQYARAFPPAAYDLVLVQYGLVDSWLTFRYAPYALYYPDTRWRKLWRKVVKKLKKWGRPLRLKALLGAVNVVPEQEYLANIAGVLGELASRPVVLLATPPNLDEPRNPLIRQYNAALARLAASFPQVILVDPYAALDAQREAVFDADGTHLNARGHALVAAMIHEALRARGLLTS